MNDTFLLELKQNLDNCITELDSIRHLFCQNPEADFTRDRKINFSTMIDILLQLESRSLPNELMNYFDHTITAPTASAFIQQRNKLLAEGMEFLFHDFNNTCSYIQTQTYRGYRLLACDGSDVNIARNPEDESTYIHQGEKGYNKIHINALFDLLNHTYSDITVQGGKELHERQALNTMVDRYAGSTKAIFIADRGYESFNVFAHLIRKEQKFIIRIKDIHSNGIISNYALPDSEFDEQIETILTRRHTKETKENPNTYTILSPYTDFDFLDEDNKYYPTSFRIVRFKVSEGVYQCVATSLDEDQFPLEVQKNIPCQMGRIMRSLLLCASFGRISQ